jgi:hypothetical protein
MNRLGCRPATVHENARSALECGGSTPPWNRVRHKLKAAPSRRTPRCLRRTLFTGYFRSVLQTFFFRSLLRLASGDDKSNVIVLFMGTELPNVSNNRRQQVFRAQLAVPAQRLHQALFAELLSCVIE